MMITLLASVALLWIAVVGLILMVLALTRQVGVLHERVAPIGALTVDQGPKVGELAPSLTAPTVAGGMILLGRPQTAVQMLFFLSPSCPVCKKLLPILRSLVVAEPDLEIVLASDGEAGEHRAFYERERLSPFPYVLSADLGLRYRIPKVPYAVLVSADGRIKAKGLVNNREQLEGLLAAHELGVASLQEFRARALSASLPPAAADL